MEHLYVGTGNLTLPDCLASPRLRAIPPKCSSPLGGLNSSIEVESGEVLVSNRMDDLALSENQSLAVKGILPYAYGNDTALDLTYAGLYGVMPGFEQLGELDSVVLGFISLGGC